MKRILLGQLNANGDCIYATILAHQLRNDNPGAHITWAISDRCASLLNNNPHIDEVWQIPSPGLDMPELMWRVFEREAVRRYLEREYDEILLSQVSPENYQNFDGTVRPSILRALGRPITVPIENVVCVTEEEAVSVEAFVRERGIMDFEHRILFECSSRSGQSFITPHLAQEIAARLYRILPDATVIYTTSEPMQLRDSRSRYAGHLSLREIARLTHACSVFVGAGSGCTVLATSSAAKKLPSILLLRDDTSMFASFAQDFEYFGIRHPGFVEVTDKNPSHIAACIALVCREGTGPALAEYGGKVSIAFGHYRRAIETYLLRHQRYLDAAHSLLITTDRYGWTQDLIEFAARKVAPHLATDPRWFFPDRRVVGEIFRAKLADAVKDLASERLPRSAKDQGIVLPCACTDSPDDLSQ